MKKQTDPFEDVPIRHYGDDDDMEKLLSALRCISKEIACIKVEDTREKLNGSLARFNKQLAKALIADRVEE